MFTTSDVGQNTEKNKVKSSSTSYKFIFILYTAMFACMIFIVLSLLLTTRVSGTDNYQDVVADIVFYDYKTNIEISDTMDLINNGSESSVYTIVPEDLPENMSLCFKTKHAFIKVYSENDPDILYQSFYDANKFYTNSLGTNWIYIPLETKHKGQKLIIEYDLAYDDVNNGFSECCYTDSSKFMLGVASDRFAQLYISCAYMSIGLVLMVVGLLVTKLVKNDLSLFWLGALALAVSLYCFFETQVLQLLFSNVQLIHVCIMFSMALVPMPAVAYGSSFLDFKFKYLPHIFAVFDFCVFIILTILNYFDIFDYHDCLPILQALIIIAMLILATGIIRYIVSHIRKQRKPSPYTLAMMIGLGSIISTGLIDIFRQIFHINNTDAAMFIRFGFFGFLVCFAIASSERVIHAFQLSSKAKFMAKLAYEDGLTGLKNRTSYKEKIAEIEIEHQPAGIIMMDLNNLKYVNDTFGHDDGDAMITSTADIIRDVFDIPGARHYRIGGDEFVVIIQNQNIAYSCEKCLEDLTKKYGEFNANTEERFKIVIAAGFSVYDPDGSKLLKDIIDEADTNMYINKRELKKFKYLNLML